MRVTTSRWRLLAGLALAAAVVSTATLTVRSVAGSRRSALERLRSTAAQAMREAEDAEADQWAPELMAEARETLHAARVAERVQEASVWPLPDFTEASRHLDMTTDMLRQAKALALDTREEARVDAAQAIANLGDTLRHHAALARTLTAEGRRAASRARLALEQAMIFYEDSDFDRALARATEAHALSQKVSLQVASIGSRYADDDQVARWQRLADDTVAWSRRTGQPAIVVAKAEHRMTLYVGGRVAREYDVDLSGNWVADKTHQGDGAVPEGRYRIVTKKGRGQSRYHKALLLDYPNESDRQAFAAARRDGRFGAGTRIGGLIEIHGDGGQGRDWTNGCVAITNAEMDQLFARVAVGTPVTIVGALVPHSIGDLAAISVPAR